jgi:hypothetical protein
VDLQLLFPLSEGGATWSIPYPSLSVIPQYVELMRTSEEDQAKLTLSLDQLIMLGIVGTTAWPLCVSVF